MSRRSRLPPAVLLGGIMRLMAFNPSGFAAIGGTTQSFLSSLSPMIGFLLVGSVLEVQGVGWRNGLADGLETLCVVLGQPVISHLVARLWKRDERWLRYATAMNWCHIAIPLLGALLLSLALVAGGAGEASRGLAVAALGAIFVYTALLDWFLAWRGLELSPLRAAGLLCIVTFGLAALLAAPVMFRLAELGTHGAAAIAT